MDAACTDSNVLSLDDLDDVQGGCHEKPPCGGFGAYDGYGELGFGPGGGLGFGPGGGLGVLAGFPLGGNLVVGPDGSLIGTGGGSYAVGPNDWNGALQGLLAATGNNQGGLAQGPVAGVPNGGGFSIINGYPVSGYPVSGGVLSSAPAGYPPVAGAGAYGPSASPLGTPVGGAGFGNTPIF